MTIKFTPVPFAILTPFIFTCFTLLPLRYFKTIGPKMCLFIYRIISMYPMSVYSYADSLTWTCQKWSNS